MTRKKLILAGHSHLSALLKHHSIAKREAGTKGNPEPHDIRFLRLSQGLVGPNIETKGGKHVLTESVKRRIRHVVNREQPDAFVGIFMGNEYNALTLLQHPEPYDFHWPEQGLPADPGATLIPFDLMAAMLMSQCEDNVGLFWDFLTQAAPDLPKFCVLTPPPIRDETHILAYPGNFATRAKEFGISKPELRRKVYLLYCAQLRKICARLGVQVIAPPDLVIDDGYLARDYWNIDPTHGNTAYGGVMLDAVFKAVDAVAVRETAE